MSGEFKREGEALWKMERWLVWEVMGFLVVWKWIFSVMMDFFIFSISSLYIIEYLAHKINYFNHHRPHHHLLISRLHWSPPKSSQCYPLSRSSRSTPSSLILGTTLLCFSDPSPQKYQKTIWFSVPSSLTSLLFSCLSPSSPYKSDSALISSQSFILQCLKPDQLNI